MRNKYLLYAGLLLIVIVLVTAIITNNSVQEQENKLDEESSLPVADEETRQATTSPVPPTEEPTVEPSAAPTAETQMVTESVSSEIPTAETIDMEEFISMTEFFSLKIPAGWSVEEGLPGVALTIANSEAAFERYKVGTAVEPGDLVLNIGFLPFELLKQKELKSLDIQFEAPPDVFLESLMPLFRSADDVEISDINLVSLSTERDAGSLNVSEDGREGTILVFAAGDNVIAVVSAVANPGEMSGFQEITNTIANGVNFTGPEDALYGTLLGG